MKDSVDEVMVNTTLAANAPLAAKELAEARRHSLAQAALCPTSALVNTYAEKTAALADKAITGFSGINDRVGWLVHRP